MTPSLPRLISAAKRLGRHVRRELRNTYTARWGPQPSPERWVFIVGCYNSGTTLLHDLLAAHPGIGSMPNEGQYFTDQLLRPAEIGLPRLWTAEPDRFRLQEGDGQGIDPERIRRQWGAAFDNPRLPVLIEKTATNVARTRWLQRYFQPSYFIGIVRNGYAVAEGIRRKAGHPIEFAARQWRISNEIMLKDFEFLENRRIVSYEELTADPARVLLSLFEFIGVSLPRHLPLDREWPIHDQRSRIVDMNERSLAALAPEERETIRREAGDLLEVLGYSMDSRAHEL